MPNFRSVAFDASSWQFSAKIAVRQHVAGLCCAVDQGREEAFGACDGDARQRCEPAGQGKGLALDIGLRHQIVGKFQLMGLVPLIGSLAHTRRLAATGPIRAPAMPAPRAATSRLAPPACASDIRNA